MTGDQTADLVWGVNVLVLVGAALTARRLPLGQTIKMVLAWIAIFGVLLAILAFRAEFATIGNRIMAELTGRGISDGRTVRIQMAPDGHFYVRGTVNGVSTLFLVDSGATSTALSAAAARAAGLDDSFERLPVPIDTANGMVEARRAEAEIDIGGINRPDMGIVSAEAFGDTNVLGMNFLSSLAGWSVEGRWLVLTS